MIHLEFDIPPSKRGHFLKHQNPSLFALKVTVKNLQKYSLQVMVKDEWFCRLETFFMLKYFSKCYYIASYSYFNDISIRKILQIRTFKMDKLKLIVQIIEVFFCERFPWYFLLSCMSNIFLIHQNLICHLCITFTAQCNMPVFQKFHMTYNLLEHYYYSVFGGGLAIALSDHSNKDVQ